MIITKERNYQKRCSSNFSKLERISSKWPAGICWGIPFLRKSSWGTFLSLLWPCKNTEKWLKNHGKYINRAPPLNHYLYSRVGSSWAIAVSQTLTNNKKWHKSDKKVLTKKHMFRLDLLFKVLENRKLTSFKRFHVLSTIVIYKIKITLICWLLDLSSPTSVRSSLHISNE